LIQHVYEIPIGIELAVYLLWHNSYCF
jgi:hypothetical protein